MTRYVRTNEIQSSPGTSDLFSAKTDKLTRGRTLTGWEKIEATISTDLTCGSHRRHCCPCCCLPILSQARRKGRIGSNLNTCTSNWMTSFSLRAVNASQQAQLIIIMQNQRECSQFVCQMSVRGKALAMPQRGHQLQLLVTRLRNFSTSLLLLVLVHPGGRLGLGAGKHKTESKSYTALALLATWGLLSWSWQTRDQINAQKRWRGKNSIVMKSLQHYSLASVQWSSCGKQRIDL